MRLHEGAVGRAELLHLRGLVHVRDGHAPRIAQKAAPSCAVIREHGDRAHVAMVRAAAAAGDVEVRQAAAELPVAVCELVRIALVELLGLVQLRVAHPGRVRAHTVDALEPRRRRREHVHEVGRVRAVDHEGGRIAARLGVDLLHGLPQRLAARQSAVRLDREGDHDPHAGVSRGAHDPDRLVRVGHRQPADQIRVRARERPDLHRVVVLRLAGGHGVVDAIAVPARPDAAADHELRRVGGLVA